MVNKFNSISQSKITKFIKDNETIQESNYSTIGESNVYTDGNSIIAYLPSEDFYNIRPGALITANDKTRYVLTKNITNFSITLDSEVNWKNRGQGYPFTYQNPISQILDNSKNIIGYITRDYKLYLIDDLPGLEINQLNSSSDSDGLKLLNSNNLGIYIDNDGVIYKGNDNTDTWEEIGSISGEMLSYVLKTDTDVSANSWILDEDTLVSNSATKLATQQSIKAYVDNSINDIDLSSVTEYILPVASTTLGGVKSGTDITVDESGNVSVNNDSHTHNTIYYTETESDNRFLLVSNLLDEDTFSSNSATKPASQQSIKAYVDANSGSSGGSGFPLLIPNNMELDDTNINVSYGNSFSMMKTIDFGATTDGSVWISFHMLPSLDATTDIELDLVYSLSGSDDSKSVRFQTSYWCNGVGETPSSSSPIATNTNAISTGISADGKIQKTTLTAIPNSAIASNDVIILKFTRKSSDVSDTYSGTFQLLYIIPYQT